MTALFVLLVLIVTACIMFLVAKVCHHKHMEEYNLSGWERCAAHFDELKKSENEWRNKANALRAKLYEATSDFDN